MANLKDLIVNGVARIIGKTYSSEFVGNVTGDVAGNADTATKVNSSLSIEDAAGNSAITSWDGDTSETLVVGGTSPIMAAATKGKITISHNNSTVSAGTYKSVTVDAKGHVTAGTNPSTLNGYGITDAKIANGVITLGSNTITPLTSSSTLAASKVSGVLAADNIPKLDASKIDSGTIDIERLPATALERCVVVANDTARFALTTSSVQVGDTVKVTDTKKMYMVVDSSKLSSPAGYEEYFTSTDWSTITNKPSSYTPSTHKHTKSQITDFPTSMPASDVYPWAKAETKPSYTWSEITNKPTSFTPASHTHTKSQITDFPSSMPASDVYSWAKAENKPSYSWGEITSKPTEFKPESHNHDEYYYRKEQVTEMVQDPTANTPGSCVGYGQDVLGGY